MVRGSRHLTVGAVLGDVPEVTSRERFLTRIVLSGNQSDEATVRKHLNNNPALEKVEDPIGLHTEAVPYERLIVCGAADLKDRLSQSLPNYFAPLAYRKLNFDISSAPHLGSSSVLFGDALVSGLNRARGHIVLKHEKKTYNPFEPDAGGGLTPSYIKGGQSHEVIAFGQSKVSEGLPWVELEGQFSGLALSISPGNNCPHVHLCRFLEPAAEGQRGAVLGEPISTAQVTTDDCFGVYNARFDAEDLDVLIVPDSSFTRVVHQKRSKLDHFEILGLFFPMPSISRFLQSAVLCFDSNRRVLSCAMLNEEARVVFVGRSERRVLRCGRLSENFGRSGAIPTLGLKLIVKSTNSYGLPPGWGLISSTDNTALGWLPLRFARTNPPSDFDVNQKSLRYHRFNWVGLDSGLDKSEAIYLDWLNEVVQLQIVDQSNDRETVSIGLAEYCAVWQNELFAGFLFVRNGEIYLRRNSREVEPLRNGKVLRLGPLLVRAHIDDNRQL